MDVQKATPIDAAVAASLGEFVSLRRDLHRHPELAFKEKRTSALVAERLIAYGYEVSEGLGGTGVVGVLRKGNGSKRLALRADMDALPIGEQTGMDYSSQNAGVMHACGHDGHTAILLLAAKALSEKPFSGTLILIFQPAEEVVDQALKCLAQGGGLVVPRFLNRVMALSSRLLPPALSAKLVAWIMWLPSHESQ